MQDTQQNDIQHYYTQNKGLVTLRIVTVGIIDTQHNKRNYAECRHAESQCSSTLARVPNHMSNQDTFSHPFGVKAPIP